MKHSWRIKRQYFDQLLSGEKTLEVRVGYSWVRRVKIGDTISFSDYNDSVEFLVTKIHTFASFNDLLENCQPEQIIPNTSKEELGKRLRELYPTDKERLGVYAFQLELPKISILSAQNSLTRGVLLNQIIYSGYNLTDWITTDYPNHLEHYYKKYVPGIFNGDREILLAIYGKKPVGVCILKRGDEQKISTLFIKEDYRGMGIATQLLEKAFKFLGTEQPLITIAEYKVPQFQKIINRYRWTLTQKLPASYYGNSPEYVFNGHITR